MIYGRADVRSFPLRLMSRSPEVTRPSARQKNTSICRCFGAGLLGTGRQTDTGAFVTFAGGRIASAVARLDSSYVNVLQQAHRELPSHKKSLESILSKPIDQPSNAFVTAPR